MLFNTDALKNDTLNKPAATPVVTPGAAEPKPAAAEEAGSTPGANGNAQGGAAEGPTEAEKQAAETQRLADEKKAADEKLAAEGAGGTPQTEEEKKAAEDKRLADEKKATEDAAEQKKIDDAKKTYEAELFKKFGVTSMEELEKKMKGPDAPETEEQKRERETRERANIDHFATSNKIMTREEIVQLENLNGRTNEDVAFEHFSKGYRAAHPEEKSEDTIRAEFRNFYNLDSPNAFLKSEGEKNIERLAYGVKAPLQQKYDTAKERFQKGMESTSKYQKFEKFVTTEVAQAIPKRLEIVKGDSPELAIGYDIPASETEEIVKLLMNDEEFNRYVRTGDEQQARTFLKENVSNIIKLRHWDKIIDTVRDAAINQGKKLGSTTGAEQPFPLKKNPEGVPLIQDKITAEDDAKVKKAFPSVSGR